MSTKLLATALLFCSVAYAAPGTTIVGTATVRGNMLIDGNQVTGDATLFDGTIVETVAASATLRMSQNSIIEMAAGTRGIVHENYVRLEQGSVDVKPTCGFVVEVNGVRITPNSLNSHGVVITSGSGASVSSRSGELFILDSHGRILERVHSGGSQSLSAGQTQPAGAASYVGNLSTLDGHRLLTLLAPDEHVVYELQGRHADNIQGNLMEISGTIDSKRNSILAVVGDVIAPTRDRKMCAEKKPLYPWLIGAAAAAGTATGIAVTDDSRVSASR